MPPKPAPKIGSAGASKKTEQKKKEKVIEDKTFGLKNKKGSKQQKFIQQVQKQVQQGGNKSAKQMDKEKEEQKQKKDLKKKELMDINNLFKPVQQMAAKGVDPKSVLCAFFKEGLCNKGAKCKFSHDLSVERRGEKRSAYVDIRDNKETSENWDEETLKDVVERKHGSEKNRPTTDIICKYFLDAVEEGKYGWFWECPNGEKCIYKHALPNGYVLKKDRKKMDKDTEEISLEDLIEKERAALGATLTKVTLETFLVWKKKKLKEKEEREKSDHDRKKRDYKIGKDYGISGREMFIFNPDLASGEYNMEDDDEDFDIGNMKMVPHEESGEEDEIEYREIDFNTLIADYKDVPEEVPGLCASDTGAPYKRLLVNNSDDALKDVLTNGDELDSSSYGAVAIDEDLFDGDDEDLEELEEQLEELTMTL